MANSLNKLKTSKDKTGLRSKTPSAQWIQLRKDLYRQVESQVRHLLGGESAELRRYREDYEKDFRKPWKPSHRQELVEAINSSKIVLMGDFHAIQQSQKAHLRVLKFLKDPKKWVIGAEFFEARHQKYLDAYLSGELSERELLKAIEWKKNWGFPWEYYRPIVRFAQKKGMSIVALNARTDEDLSLSDRDEFAAKKLAKYLLKSDKSAFVIFGDLHLASSHLSKSMQKHLHLQAAQVVSVYQNSERLYFQLLESSEEDQVDILKIGNNNFCLMNVAPWVKWQSYLLFLEHTSDRSLRASDHDFTDDVSKYLKVIAHAVNLPMPQNSFSIYSPKDSNFWPMISGKMKDREAKWFQSFIEEGYSFYIPNLQIGYLARPTVNHAAALATSVLHHFATNTQQSIYAMPDQFSSLIWQEAIQYFGSKFINPKRKTDTLVDLKAALSSRSPADQGKEALQLALSQKMQELLYLSGAVKVKNQIRPIKLSSYREAARILGGMLGEKLYFAYRKGLISGFSMQGLLTKKFSEANFPSIYYELLELVESLPEPFQSKSDKL